MRELLAEYVRLMPFLGNVLADQYEIMLFEVNGKKVTLLEQSDWNSGVADEVTRLLKDKLKDQKVPEQGQCCEQMISEGDSGIHNVSMLFLKEEEQVVGAFCIAVDCMNVFRLHSLMNSLLPKAVRFIDGEQERDGFMAGSLSAEERMVRIIDEFCSDPAELTPQERTEVMMDLIDAGVFRVKGMVPLAAEKLQMSEQSVYRYLTKIKRMRQQ